MPDLTENQTILLREVCQGPCTTAELALLAKHNSHANFGVDAARSAMVRLESRGLVSGSEAAGTARVWTATDAGREAIGLKPLPKSEPRGYVMLEEVSLADAVRAAGEDLDGLVVYKKVGRVVGHNTDHAIRQTTKQAYGNNEGSATLVAVAERQWRPTEVHFRSRQTVSIG
jgi:hypothetical protein